VESAEEFRKICRGILPDRIILDLHLRDSDGIELLRFLAEEKSQAEIILVSGFDKKTLVTAENLGRQHGLRMSKSLQKPLTLDVLRKTLKGTVEDKYEFSNGELSQALAEKQIIIHYQPQVQRQESGYWDVHRVEALARWNHPKRRLIPPDKFIKQMEEVGLIAELTEYVLQESLQQLQTWEQDDKKISIAVNISGKVMSDLDLPSRIEGLSQKFSIDPSRIMLELTETAVMDNVSRANEIMVRLRLKGFSLSLDDFGTGYSSLVQLYRLPFSELKIDRSFVRDIHTNKEAEVIVHTLVELARNLGLKACAEGIEDEKTFEFLQRLGCREMQGYYFSKPIPAEDVFPTMIQWKNKQPSGIIGRAPD
jgi:EAL domain-containing protein (putative c-di-GMP-specific phosphodiesterase class I)